MLLKCQRDPFLQEFTARVVSCQEVKKGKKRHYEVVLEDTILFAEGGGQPCDHGTLQTFCCDVSAGVQGLNLTQSDSVNVTDVQRKDGTAIHTTNKPVTAESNVKVALDWTRRWDHMQQHTGQHLLSAIAEQQYNMKTVSWNLGLEVCHVELNTTELTDEIREHLQADINKLIRDSLPVVTSVFSSKEDPGLSSAHTRGLPADHSGPVRVVEIQGVDQNMCCGTHLTNLSQIQMIKLLHTESKRGNTLLYFVCGERVLNTLHSALAIHTSLNSLLTCPPDLFVGQVTKIQKEGKSYKRQAEKLSEELAVMLAATLIQQHGKVMFLQRDEIDAEFSVVLQRQLKEETESRVLLLVSGGTGAAQFMLKGPVELINKFGKEAGTILGGKGGGRDGRFQGKFSDLTKVPAALQFLRDNIS